MSPLCSRVHTYMYIEYIDVHRVELNVPTTNGTITSNQVILHDYIVPNQNP